MMTIQEEIRAEKASYLDLNEIREKQAYEELEQKRLQKIRAKKEQQIQETKTYIKDKLSISITKVIKEEKGIQITQEEINEYPHIGGNNEIKNEWNKKVLNQINQVLDIRYCFSDNPKISIVSESESLHCKEEPIYATDIFGNETDIIDVLYDPITIIHIKFGKYDFHLFATHQYNKFDVASKLIYLPQIITNGYVKYELQKEDE